jgi:hypothetical protein
MPDLQHIDRREQTTIDQLRLDWRLGVSRQQCRESALPDHHDHRSVIDVAFRQGGRGIGIGRVQDVDRCRLVEREMLAGTRERHGYAGVGSIGQQAVVCRVLERDPAVEHGSDVESGENVDQPGDMVLVRVGQDEQVDPAREEGKVGAETAEGQLRVRPAIDQHRCARRGLDQDRVALSDVQHGQMEVPVRS